MADQAYNYVAGARAGIKMWTRGVPVEESAMAQVRNVAGLPFIHKHVAVMPDAHWGMGATVGTVIATSGAVVPAAVGVDIGCGMIARRTNLTASDLPDNLSGLRSSVEAAVPHGRTSHGGAGDRGAWGETIPGNAGKAWDRLQDRYNTITDKHPKAGAQNNFRAPLRIGELSEDIV